jgi:AraC-like DNA-binding protein
VSGPAGLAYREHPAPAELQPHVVCLWTLRVARGCPLAPQRVLPDGGVELLFHLGEPNAHLDGGVARREPAVAVVGASSRAVTVQPAPGAEVLGVRFRPGGALRFLPLPAVELRDRIVALDDALPRWGGTALAARLRGTADGAERRRLVAAALAWRARAHDGQGDPLVDHAVRAILRRRGALRVDALAAALGTSARRLERRFARAVGLPPKLLCRVVRAGAAARALLAGTRPSELDFADQPHATRELRAIAGTTPARLRRERPALAALFLGGVANRQDRAALDPLR